MKIIRLTLFALLFALAVSPAKSQTYVKLNGLYALAGVINPAVEFTIAPKSTFQTELVISPWKNFRLGNTEGPMKFLILMNEYRRYFRQHNDGWYVGANFGLTAFHMTKPTFFDNGKLRLKDVSGKGYGIMIGVVGGYEWVFNNKWILDAFFGWAWMGSWYNGYALKDGVVDNGYVYNKGELILHPHGHEQDPFNGSGEWLPNKIGVSFGIKIIDPNKRKSNY